MLLLRKLAPGSIYRFKERMAVYNPFRVLVDLFVIIVIVMLNNKVKTKWIKIFFFYSA